MKRHIRLLLIITILIAGNHGFARDYIKMIREDRIWVYNGSGWELNENHNYDFYTVYHFFKFDGSIEINNNIYSSFLLFKTDLIKQILDGNNFIEDYENTKSLERNLRFFLREEPGKVYALAKGSELLTMEGPIENNNVESLNQDEVYEIVKYDFTLQEGEPITMSHFNGASNIIPTGKEFFTHWCGEIALYDETCSVLWPLKNKPDSYSSIIYNPSNWFDGIPSLIIEGIGITGNGCLPSFALDQISGSVNQIDFPKEYSSLFAVYDNNGNTVYSKESFNEWIARQAIVNLPIIDNKAVPNLYDLHGTQISYPLPCSIYIRDGKKFVAK